MKIRTNGRRDVTTRLLAISLAAAMALPLVARAYDGDRRDGDRRKDERRDDDRDRTLTPITHVVVIFQENVSFDHYFATYPNAANTDGSPFAAAPGTPIVNGLFPGGLLTHNPNSTQPFRLGPANAVTCDQGHGYSAEQRAYAWPAKRPARHPIAGAGATSRARG